MKVQHSPWNYPLLLLALGFSALVFFTLPGKGQASAAGPGQPPADAAQAAVCRDYGRLPLYFIENRGQVDKRVKYYARGNGHTAFFTREGVALNLAQGQKEDGAVAPRPAQYAVVRMQPVGLKKKVQLKALLPQEGKVNYFLGNDPQKWRAGIPTFQAVVYEEAYQGIDLKFYGQGRELEYDVVVKPGADPGQVRFAYEGVKELRLTDAGDLALLLPDGGELIQKKPYVYQEINGKRVLREGRFRIARAQGQWRYGFQVAAYDKTRPLVIDPVLLVYSTYLGGTQNEKGNAIAVDSEGNAYLTGYTVSDDFPVLNPYQATRKGGVDAFVTKLTPAGQLSYSTYLGGSGEDYGYGIAVEGPHAYITGETGSMDFPTLNPFQSTNKGNKDAFVTKLTAEGLLAYSTYLGGQVEDRGCGIAASGGNAYVTGYTRSSNFPTFNPYQAAIKGNMDAFVSKFTATGALAYSTFLGGTINDYGYGIAVNAGNAYVTGLTYSTDFPLQSPYQAVKKGEGDAFVTRLTAAGDGLTYSTYLGGSLGDCGRGIAADSGGKAYVTGYTASADFPILNPFQGAIKGTYDAFVTGLTPAGNALSYSTYLGGSDKDYGYGIALNPMGNAYITGSTYSDDFPTKNPYQGARKGSWDAFVTSLTPAGSALAFSTYLGGSGYDEAYGIALDSGGKAYVTGETYSADFPTQNPYQGAIKGGWDAFVTKLGLGGDVSFQLLLMDDEPAGGR